jgi:hypothetical protein
MTSAAMRSATARCRASRLRWWLGGHLVLARRIDNPRFHRIETYSPRNVLHAFRLTAPEDVDDEFREWLVEAYHVGEQPHLS